MKNLPTELNYTAIQLKFPLDITKTVEITDPVYTFSEVMKHIDLRKYYATKESELGRPRYDAEKLMKVTLFSFMENGYSSLRNIEKLCKTEIRYIWLLDGEKAPTYATVCNFLNKYVGKNIEKMFNDVNEYIFMKEKVDTNHVYIDGTKIEANANKYSWVWKKACLNSREKLYSKITKLLEEINETVLQFLNIRFEIREEYAIEYMEQICIQYMQITQIDTGKIPRGRGHHKTLEQRQYQILTEYTKRLKTYANHIKICGENRNSYSKTDTSATFMRIKRDYMGNDQLLPAYNMQIGICDEYIAVIDAQQYASDMDCFVPLMEKFRHTYGKYPEYPVADAGYGSYNNYLYCEEHGMKKYMKYSMFKKECTDPAYRENPYRSVNFKRDENGNPVCPNGKSFRFLFNKKIYGNRYGRTEEIYECENCDGCPLHDQCHKSKSNRRIAMNREMTSMYAEAKDNLTDIHGILLRTNRSIQAEGTFGVMKWDRGYKRARRRSLDSILFEFALIAVGFNLYKFHNNKISHLQQFAA